MKTNFFEAIAALHAEGDWKMTIKKDGGEQLIVSLLLSNEKCGDEARKLVPPMILKGTATELDEGFFKAIEQPVKQTAGLFTNMENYLRQLDEAKWHSKMESEKQDREKKEKEELRKKYEAQMKKVEELEEKEKWGEAIGQLPKAEQFPEQAEDIKKKGDELRKKHSSLSLFES
jgi:PRTRC genetic system protein E